MTKVTLENINVFGYNSKGEPISDKLVLDEKTGLYTTTLAFSEAYICNDIMISKTAITDNLYSGYFPDPLEIKEV